MGEAGHKSGVDSGRIGPALVLLALAGPLLPVAMQLAPPGAGGLAGTAFLAAALAAVAGMHRHYRHDRPGLANAITLARAALAAAVLAWAVRPESAGYALTLIAVVALVLDGLDGPAARRAGLVSRFGFWFDMEVDALLAFALALFVWTAGKAGVWVLLLGLAHPLFLLAGLALPALRAPLAESWRRKAVCVVQIAALAALTLPELAPPVSGWLAGGVLALVGWSFAVDIRWLIRR